MYMWETKASSSSKFELSSYAVGRCNGIHDTWFFVPSLNILQILHLLKALQGYDGLLTGNMAITSPMTLAKFINKFKKTRSGHPRTCSDEGTTHVVLTHIVYIVQYVWTPYGFHTYGINIYVYYDIFILYIKYAHQPCKFSCYSVTSSYCSHYALCSLLHECRLFASVNCITHSSIHCKPLYLIIWDHFSPLVK